MPIQVQGPDGRMHSYPDGTSDDAISSDMRTIYKGAKGPSVPRAGDPTALTGPSYAPRMQSVQPYQNDEDRRQLAIQMILGEKNRGIGQVIQNTPGHIQRVEEAKKVGQAQGDLQETQRNGAANLRLLDQIRATFNEADPDTQAGAIGPRNTAKLPAEAPLTVMGYAVPGIHRPSTIDPETGIPIKDELTPVQRAAILNPKDEKASKAWNLQNRLHHDIEGLVTKFIMAGKGLNMSNDRQEAFTNTIGAMLKATSQEEFHNIANDAENILRETFGLTVPQANSAPGIHPGAVQELMKNTSAKARAQFDEIFGEGQADQIIATEKARGARRLQ